MKADGQGNIAAFTVNGSLANVNSGDSIIAERCGFHLFALGRRGWNRDFSGQFDDKTEIVSGAKVLYVSADGNWFVGGSATGSDMFFGFRAPSGTSSNSLLSGTYFVAGMEDYVGRLSRIFWMPFMVPSTLLEMEP